MVLFHIGLNRNRHMRLQRSNLLLGGRQVVSAMDAVIAGVVTGAGSLPRRLGGAHNTSTTTGGDPMDGDGVQSHIGSTGRQADQATLVTLEDDQGRDVACTENQGDDTAQEGSTGNITQLTLGGALEQRSGAHEGADEQEGQPARDKDIVKDQGIGSLRSQADVALSAFFRTKLRVLVGNHKGDDDRVRHQQS